MLLLSTLCIPFIAAIILLFVKHNEKANYVAIALPIADVTGFGSSPIKLGSTPTTSTVSFRPVNNNTYYDASILSVAIFR